MCGRYAVTLPPDAMRDLFGFEERPNFPPRFNIAPTQPVPVVVTHDGKRHFMLMRWGLIPSWAKEPPKSLLINARAETVAEKPSFRGAFRHHRALMPADGFYEWRQTEGKQPYFICRADRRTFAMAAVTDHWLASDGSEVDTAAVVTCAANAALRPIHHRMPVILEEKDWAAWLDPETPLKEAEALLRPAPDDWLTAWPVGREVNRVVNDHESLIEERKPAEPHEEKAPEDRQMKLL